jgi:hypothetical protein
LLTNNAVVVSQDSYSLFSKLISAFVACHAGMYRNFMERHFNLVFDAISERLVVLRYWLFGNVCAVEPFSDPFVVMAFLLFFDTKISKKNYKILVSFITAFNYFITKIIKRLAWCPQA